MKTALAKLMEKNPTQSSHIAFRAGGNGVPILTRNSSQSTTGYQTMGLPDGSKPMPGGGANKTTLGAYRMGESDGNGAPSAIYPGDIFGPIGQPGREYPERTFANVGNNVFQPEYDDKATSALLKRLGDQKFKATSMAPFEDYRAQQRLARDLEEASRNASLSDLGVSREIIRNVAAQRRQQNEDDYLRKILDAGGSPESARKEIEDVRNANALQEARKVDDREYQAKTLIQRIAMSRGVTPMVREHLNQSSSIDNPQPSMAMSQAMGKPGEGFGSSPLDMNRQFMTPDFYRRNLRRSTVSQEASDQATAFSNLITGAGEEDQLKDLPSGFSMATVKGQERQQQIEIAAEALASRLDSIRQRAQRIKLPLPKPVFVKKIIQALYNLKTKSAGNKVIYSPETIQDLNPLQLLLAINWSMQSESNGFQRIKKELGKYTWGTAENPSGNFLNDLRMVAYAMNKNSQDIRIPFASASMSYDVKDIINTLNDIKTSSSPELRNEIEQGRMDLLREMTAEEEAAMEVNPTVMQPLPRGPRATSRKVRRAAPQEQLPQMDEEPVPGAPGDDYDSKTNKELKVLLRAAGLNQGGNSADLKARLRRGTN
jgi:uncharacterized protein YjiS (DUF1127 family)